MEFYFYPANEDAFKEKAVNNFVRTLVFDAHRNEVVLSFARKVSKKWEQTLKNNIETDHRIKGLRDSQYQVYSWITSSKSVFGLPHFVDK